jgi:hypothetical protein
LSGVDEQYQGRLKASYQRGKIFRRSSGYDNLTGGTGKPGLEATRDFQTDRVVSAQF